jgi:WD40 repeat protein/uncharacterized caspase-like protein
MANNWAIVIGINDYQHHPERKLKYAVNDAQKMSNFLSQQTGFGEAHVIRCLGDATHQGSSTYPTCSNLLRSLKRDLHPDRLGKVDHLWFYFSGHGVSRNGRDYLITADCLEDEIERFALPIDEVIATLRLHKDADIVLVLDACRQLLGRKTFDNSIGEQTIAAAKERGITTIFSCDYGQYSYELDALQQGAFTYALVEGLSQHTLPIQLETYLRQQVPELHRQHRRDLVEQIPRIRLESLSKSFQPLLPDAVTAADLEVLLEQAKADELEENFETAKKLWWHVIDISQSSVQRQEARNAIERIEHKIAQWGSVASTALSTATRINFLNAPQLPLNFLPRSSDLDVIKALLLVEPESSSEVPNLKQKVGIWGMSGIGKSVLASWVAQDEEIKSKFPDGVFWLVLGQEPNLVFGQLQLAKALGAQISNFEDEEDGRNYLRDLLVNKSCLIVLDDVWYVKHAIAFDALGARCQILLTSQDVEIIRALGAREYLVEKFSDLQAWELLAEWVKESVESLPPEAKEVARECENLPLALSLCGAMVRDGISWNDLVDALHEADLSFIEKRQFQDYPNPNVLKAIKVSVDALAKDDPICAKYYYELAVFPSDESVLETAVYTLWLRDGDLKERHARKWLNRLESRALLQLDHHQSRVKLHSLQYKYLLAIQSNLSNLHYQLLEAYRCKGKGIWSSVPSDGYFFQHFAYHLVASGHNDELRQLQLSFKWLRAKLNATDINGVIADFQFVQSDETCQLVQKTLHRSAHILAQDKKQLAGQLLGRLMSYELPEIQALLEQAREEKTDPWLRPLVPSLMSPEGPLLRTLAGHDSLVRAVAVTSDGKYAVSATDQYLKIWDLKSGFEIQTWKHFWVTDGVITVRPIKAMAITPDGKYAVIAADSFDIGGDILEVFDLEHGSIVSDWKAHDSSIQAVAISADGLSIVSGSIDRTVKIWDLASGEELRTLKGHTMTVSAVAVTLDGQYIVSACDDGTLKVWDFCTGRELRTLVGHDEIITSVAVGANGKIVSGSWDKTVRVWDLETGNELHTFTDHDEWILTVAITPDGQYVISGSSDKTLKVWNLDDNLDLSRTLIGHTGSVAAVAVTPDGQFVISGSQDYTLKIWALEIEASEDSSIAHADSVRSVAVTPNDKYVISASNDRTLKVWNLEDQVNLWTYVGHTNSITSVATTPDGHKIISAAHDCLLKVWGFDSRAELQTLNGHAKGVKSIAITPDGKNLLSVSSDGNIMVWDLQEGSIQNCLNFNDETIGIIAITPDGNRAVFNCERHDLKIWDLRKNKEVTTFKAHRTYIEAITITPNGKYIVSASGEAVKIWESKTGEIVKTLYPHEASITDIVVTADGEYILSTGRDQTLKFWHLKSGREITSFSGDSPFFCCAITQDGKNIIAGEASGRLHFLRLENFLLKTNEAKDSIKTWLSNSQSRKRATKQQHGFGK